MVATHPEGYVDDVAGISIPSWQELWDDETNNPLFWYLYPDGGTINIEYENKWKKYLPKNEFIDDPKFGYKMSKKNGIPFALEFNSGARLYFRSYSQDKGNIQSVSVHMINTDEELHPAELYDELTARTFATRGYFNMVFTATHGDQMWERAMNIGHPRETFKQSFKKTISAYDCLKYSDGTKSQWNEERINENKNKCKSKAEIDRRIYGKFVLDAGLVYESFSAVRNVTNRKTVPENWIKYVGIDIGSGGKNHPASIAFVAVRTDFKLAYMYDFWRGDDVITTAADIADKFIEMKGDQFIHYVYYDWHSRDFFNIAISKGIGARPAEKSHEIGEHLLNALFKNKMLMLFDSPETEKLVAELKSLKTGTKKHQAKDDGIDALRYAISSINFNFSSIEKKKEIKVEKREERPNNRGPEDDAMDELEEWSQYYDVF